MRHSAAVFFTLPACKRFEDSFLFGGLGVEDEHNGLHVIPFGGAGPKRKSTDQSQQHRKNWNNKFGILLQLILFDLFKDILPSHKNVYVKFRGYDEI